MPPTCGPGRSTRCASGSRAVARVRRRAAARPGADERRAGDLAGQAPRALPLRASCGAAAGARGRRSLGLHDAQPGEAAPGATASRRRARSGPTRAPRSTRSAPSFAAYRRCPRSPRRPACGPRSGRRSSAATWTAAPACSTSAAPCPAARWSSSARPPAAAGRCRSRDARSTALDALPARLDTPLLFPAPSGGLLNLDNLRRREWAPGDRGGGHRARRRGSTTCARRSPRDALAAGVSVFGSPGSWARASA